MLMPLTLHHMFGLVFIIDNHLLYSSVLSVKQAQHATCIILFFLSQLPVDAILQRAGDILITIRIFET